MIFCSHCFWLMARAERGTRLTYIVPLRISPSSPPTNSTMSVTSGDCLRMAAAAAETRDVSAKVPPGGSSISSVALAKSSGGMNAVGIVYDEGVAAQRVGSQYRSDEPRDHERDEDGRRDSQAELFEVLAAHTAHETYRQKHRDDGGRRRHHRQADFVRRIDGRLKAALAHAHVPNDVFYFDDGVVHEYAGNQREPEQRDLIEGEAHPLHEDEGGYRRQRNGQRGDHRRAHIAQKKPYDGDRENRPFHEGAHRRVVGAHGMVDRGENGCHADRGILGPY